MKRVSKIGLGSVQFGLAYGISNTKGQTSDLDVSEILSLAHNYGISTIDTAASYGSSEKVIGRHNQNRFEIVSKFMPSNNGVPIINQFQNSLDSLQVTSLYGYLAHRPLDLISNKKDWEDIQILKSSGRIKKIGFSLNQPEEYYQLLDAGIVPDIIQVPFNYFDTRFQDVLIKLKSEGCEIHSRSTFLQGLFFINIDNLDSFFSPLFSELRYLQSTFGKGLSSALLKYVVNQPFIDKVILGVENVAQLEENLAGLESVLLIRPLDKKFENALVMPMHWPK